MLLNRLSVNTNYWALCSGVRTDPQPVKWSLVASTLDPCPRLSFPLQYWYQMGISGVRGVYLLAELSGKESWGTFSIPALMPSFLNTPWCSSVVSLAHTLALRVFIFPPKCPTDVNASSWLLVLQRSRTGLRVPLASLNPIKFLTLLCAFLLFPQ